jgi:hypothetical protein
VTVILPSAPLCTRTPERPGGDKRPGSAKRPKTAELTIHREEPLHAEGLPVGSKFRCYEPYVVQELTIKNENTRYLRARYDLPGGGSMLAPFPAGVLPIAGGHFGANLIAYILDQYHQAQVTEPLLLEQLWEYGIDISAGQLHHILTENHELFHQEKDEIRAAGLTASAYIGTDDTGARHQGKNGYCTVIGNDLFAYFESSDTKSRLNFLHCSKRVCPPWEIQTERTALVFMSHKHGGQPRHAVYSSKFDAQFKLHADDVRRHSHPVRHRTRRSARR